MFNRIIKLLKGKTASSAPTEPDVSATGAESPEFSQLNAIAPVSANGANTLASAENGGDFISANTIPPSVVCREAVLNQTQKVAGYFFTLSRNINERVRASSAIVQRLYDEVLLRNILNMDIQRLLGHRLAFIPVLPSSLEHPLLQQLPRQGTVLVVNSLEQLLNDSEVMLARLTALKNAGFRIGLQGSIDLPGMQAFMELAEFIFIDIGSSDLPTITTRIANINKQVFDKPLVATNIRTLDEFHVCARLPFVYFQGQFVTSREAWTTPRMDAGRIKILDLLNRIRQDAENAELVQLFKQDPALSFKILRYLNSAGSGLTTKVNSIDQALLILGRQNLYRWLTLLLFTSGAGDELDWALMENALVRARLAELCASDSLPANERDELFVTGIFSLLDILLHMTMQRVLQQISLPALAEEALLHQTGKYAPYLQLAIACEAFDHERITALSAQIGLDMAQVNVYHADALIWAEQLNE
ncbi:EAL and HDOD domain-containing protein [Sulfuriferula thiophila]|uniref:EAL and HDOD domain-containing protein n=1 Tax=Sulfuriferula thiophila TaxID=1781211 RepID=UPI000F6057C7|nr:HDOD domain-containing protein [Sulfuriferula thiophila]